MRLVIERSELLRALGHVTSVVERRTTIPILSNVMLKAASGALEFKATDLEREVIEAVPAEVSEPGAVTVPAHMLHDIVRKLPDGAEVEMRRDAEKERLSITAGSGPLSPPTPPATPTPPPKKPPLSRRRRARAPRRRPRPATRLRSTRQRLSSSRRGQQPSART